jgi:hypothetical protein
MVIAFPSEETTTRDDSAPTPPAAPKKPLSEKRLAANRLNALRSTGPRTPAGKQRVSANALKHGLRATTHLCPEESNHPAECSATYKTFEHELYEELQPKTILQKTLFPQIATLAWRLRRLPHTEQEIFAQITNHRFPPPRSAAAHDAPADNDAPAQLPSSILTLPSSSPPPPPCQTLAEAFCSNNNTNPFTLFNRYERSLQNAFLRLLRHYDHLKKHHDTRPTTPEETCPREPAWRDPLPPPPPPPPITTDDPQPQVAHHDHALPNKPTETPATIANPQSTITALTQSDKQTHQTQSPTHSTPLPLLLILCALCASAVNPTKPDRPDHTRQVLLHTSTPECGLRALRPAIDLYSEC